MQFKKVAALGLSLCLAFAGSGCSGEKTAVYVQQVSALTGVSTGERFTGMVVSDKISEIKKDADKTVAELLVKEGQDVKEGDPLFSYDTDQLQLAADKLDLEREQLSASMDDYEVQIGELERDREKAGANQKLQYTIQIQSLQVSQKEAELKMKTKQAELKKARDLLENATVTSPVTGRIQAVNENGTDSQGNPAPYITIQQAGAYRVKGILGELQQGVIREGDRMRMTSRVDPDKTWLGTVTLVDFENPVRSDSNQAIAIAASTSDSMVTASKYPFYVELDSMEGLIMGQHLYMEVDSSASGFAGIPLSSGFICMEEDGSAYVWAENNSGKLEKRTVTLGEYFEDRDLYDVRSGLKASDYIAFPDPEICKSGAPTSHTPVYNEESGGEGGDMPGEAVELPEDGEITQEDLEQAAQDIADGEISAEDMEKALEGGVK